MSLASIHSLSNIPNESSVVQWLKKNWWIASIIIGIHFLVIYLWILKPDIEQTEMLDELVIDLSLSPIIINKSEQRPQEYLEKKYMPDAVKPARGLLATPSLPSSQAQPSEVAQPIESAATVKLNEQPIKPIKVDKLDKVELREDKKIQTTPAEKVEEKKPLLAPQSLAKLQPPLALPSEVAQPIESAATVKLNEQPIKSIKVDKVEKVELREEKKIQITPVEKVEEKKLQPAPPPIAKPLPLLDEVIPNILPAIVDKKNKDKNMPEVAPPAASSSAAVPVDPSKGSSASAASSPASAPSSAPASPASTSASTGRQGLSMTGPPASEIQAQIVNPKLSALGSPGGNVGTADADYKSDGLKNAQPNYPLYARKMNQEGVVMLSVEVLTDGSAGDVRVATSSGIKLLDQAALEAVKRWNFKPAKKDNVLYVQRLSIPIVFSLSSK